MRHEHPRREVVAKSGRKFAKREQAPKRKPGVKSGKRNNRPQGPIAPYCVRSRPRQYTAVLTALLVVVTGLQSAAAPAEYPFSAQIVFGYGEAPPAHWTGSIRADNTRINEIKGWLFRNEDRIDLNTFELQTKHPVRPQPARKGLIVRGSASPGARIHVSTDHGDFSFSPESLNPGQEQPFLGGMVRISGMGPVEKLTDDFRYDDYPSIAVGDNNQAWVVWQSYSGQRDEIRIRKYDEHWRTFSRVPGVSGDVWRPQVALDARQRPWVVWSQQVDGNFDIYARTLDEDTNSWGELVRLSFHPNPDIDHHLVSDSKGRLWVVWQGFHGDNSDIFLRYFDGGSWSEEIRISDDPANDWEPKVAVDNRGRAHVVWDSYRNGNYDVFLRSYAGGELGPARAVAATPKFEAHASVAVDQEGRIWVAWDEGEANWAKDTGPTIDPAWLQRGRELWTSWINNPATPGARIYESRKLNLAVFEGGERKAPVADLQEALAKAEIPDHDFPQLFVDPKTGRLALLFHRWNHVSWTESLGFRPVYWEQAVIFHEGDRWSRVQTMPESWGRVSMRAGAAFGPDGTLWTVWPTDGRLYERPVRDVVGNVFAARLPAADESAPLKLKPAQEPKPVQAVPVHPNEAAEVAAIRSYRTSIHGVESRIVRGDLHRHTEFSWDSSGGMVDGSLFDFYRYMLDAAAMDFGAVTDHNSGGDNEYWWWLIEKSCDMYNVPRAFSTFYAYERSVEYPNGHRNILHTRRGVPVVSFFTEAAFDRPRPLIAASRGTVVENDTKLLYESLRRTGGISIPHTPGSQMGTDWRDNDPEVEPVVEIFQGDRISYEHPGAPRAPRSAEDKPIGGYREEGFLWSAYRKGYRLGTIASSDHWSTHISYAMVYTEEPTREAIFEAIKKRRTYGATDNIVLDYRMGDAFMGEALATSRIPPLKIHVAGTSRIARIDIIRDEAVIYTGNPNQKEVTLSYLDKDPQPGAGYYYVRVIQDDREIAWGSPIWVKFQPAR